MALSPNTKGIIATCIAMFGFVTNDTCIKLAAQDLPIGQLIAMRGVAALIFVVALASATGAIKTMPSWTDRGILMRAGGEIGAALLYYRALTQIPIANANAVLQVLPLAVTAAAALVLGEKVGWRRWTVILIGFAGVLLIIQPGSDAFQVASLWAVAALAFFVMRDIGTRFIDRSIPALSINITTTTAVMVVGFALAFVEPWEMPDARAVGLMVLAAVLLSMAYVAITVAMRSGDISITSPFRYSIVLWALIIDAVLFGNSPQTSMLVGLAIVVASGLYMIYRESQLSRSG